MKKSLYQILGIIESATQEEIKKAYRLLAVKYHPDKNIGNEVMAEEKFKELQGAYDTLSNNAARSRYDQILKNNRFKEQQKKSEQESKFKQTQNASKDYSQTNRKGNWVDALMVGLALIAILTLLFDNKKYTNKYG